MSLTFGRPRTQQSGKATSHVGKCQDFLWRHQQEAARIVDGHKTASPDFLAGLVGRIVDTRNLRIARDHLAAHGGQAPGPDGLRYQDLDHEETWRLIRALSRAILYGTYRPGRERTVKISKKQGHRTLTLQSIPDRIVQRAIAQILQPLLDPVQDAQSFAFRPRKSRILALATAEHLAGQEGRWVWVIQDLRDAFGAVPLERLMDVVRMHLPDNAVLRLLRTVLGEDRKHGLRQGGSLSPLLLNLYLNHFLDRPWRRKHPTIPLLRWADDLLLLCHASEEASKVDLDLKNLVQSAGFQLKFEFSEAVHHLQKGGVAHWLGFAIAKGEERLRIGLSEDAWNSLENHLEEDHDQPCPPLRAIATIRNWLGQIGPCYPDMDVDQTLARVEEMARTQAFDEIPWPDLHEWWANAHRRWQEVRQLAATKH